MPGLLDAVRFNLNHQRRDLKLFEIGKVFAAQNTEDRLPREREMFGLAITGGETLQKYLEPIRPLDFYDAKGSVEAALETYITCGRASLPGYISMAALSAIWAD